MALLDVRHIYKSYADNSILEGVSLQLRAGDRVGLLGRNGSGKTTLLKIITGEEEPDSGEIYRGKGLNLGYLSQKPGFLPEASLYEILREALEDVYQLKNEIARLEEEMASGSAGQGEEYIASLMTRYGELTHIFEERGGYMLENRLGMVALGLGFSEKDLSRQVGNFSGGEKTRVQLAALLLREPDLLLLDEPTNSLDTESVEWLENYLVNWRGALLVVSHDRFFLDGIAGQIAILEKRGIRLYKGNYSAYQLQREIERSTLEKASKKQEETIRKDEEFIRNAAAETKRQARSREKRLGKLAQVEKHEDAPSWKARFGFASRISNRSVVTLEDVSKRFDRNVVFKGASFEINWGDRLAVVGPNGAGKTTLLRIITGEETGYDGLVRFGTGIKMAYFDQEQKTLRNELTVLENILEASRMGEDEARRFLGSYLFRGEDVFKKVEALSGGERSRLALAKMTLDESNFLILDEPTNHLDIWGIEELEKALAVFPGTLLLVSHDRFFISRTATKIIDVRDKKVRLYKEPYSVYREIRLKEKSREAAPVSAAEALKIQERRAKKEEEKAKRDEIMALRRQRRDLIRAMTEIEEKASAGESRIVSLQEELSKPGIYDDYTKARPLLDELAQTKDEVGALYEEWERLALLKEELPQEE